MKFRSRLKQIFAVAILSLPALALAQPSAPAPSGPATQEQIASLQAAVQNAQSNADNAWMLVSAALVLLMTGPGLALFYGGLVRKKNILGTMMQSFAMMGLVTILWAILGYSLAFGHGTTSGPLAVQSISRQCQNCHTEVHGTNSPSGPLLHR